MTGGKRLIQHLNQKYGHFADVIVADALYLNAPFINTVLGCGMDAVIRLNCHKATEVIFELMIVGFNMRELYLYRRVKGLAKTKITQKSAIRKLCDDLQGDCRKAIYSNDG